MCKPLKVELAMIVGIALCLLILDRTYQSTRYALITIPVIFCVFAGAAIWQGHRRRESRR